MRPIRVLHLLSRFNYGGTERQLIERLRRHPPGFEALVGCFEAWGPFLEPIRALGYEPYVLPLRGLARPEAAVQVVRMAALIWKLGVRLVHANDFATSVIGVAAARIAGVRVIVNRVDLGHLRPRFGKWHRQLEMLAARQADVVSANAQAVRRVCIEEEGCRPDRVVVVRNGLDVRHFDELAAQLPAPLPTAESDFVVAVIGNLWPVKAHRVLLEAAAWRRAPPFGSSARAKARSVRSSSSASASWTSSAASSCSDTGWMCRRCSRTRTLSASARPRKAFPTRSPREWPRASRSSRPAWAARRSWWRRACAASWCSREIIGPWPQGSGSWKRARSSRAGWACAAGRSSRPSYRWTG